MIDVEIPIDSEIALSTKMGQHQFGVVYQQDVIHKGFILFTKIYPASYTINTLKRERERERERDSEREKTEEETVVYCQQYIRLRKTCPLRISEFDFDCSLFLCFCTSTVTCLVQFHFKKSRTENEF
jgi:hypothetical protein